MIGYVMELIVLFDRAETLADYISDFFVYIV